MKILRDIARRISASGYFDGRWYARRYPDVQRLDMDPAEHYVRIGARLLRDPGPDFSTRFYLATHADVEKAGVNPLWHYVVHGEQEGRRIAPSGYHLPPSAPTHPVQILGNQTRPRHGLAGQDLGADVPDDR